MTDKWKEVANYSIDRVSDKWLAEYLIGMEASFEMPKTLYPAAKRFFGICIDTKCVRCKKLDGYCRCEDNSPFMLCIGCVDKGLTKSIYVRTVIEIPMSGNSEKHPWNMRQIVQLIWPDTKHSLSVIPRGDTDILKRYRALPDAAVEKGGLSRDGFEKDGFVVSDSEEEEEGYLSSEPEDEEDEDFTLTDSEDEEEEKVSTKREKFHSKKSAPPAKKMNKSVTTTYEKKEVHTKREEFHSKPPKKRMNKSAVSDSEAGPRPAKKMNRTVNEELRQMIAEMNEKLQKMERKLAAGGAV